MPEVVGEEYCLGSAVEEGAECCRRPVEAAAAGCYWRPVEAAAEECLLVVEAESSLALPFELPVLALDSLVWAASLPLGLVLWESLLLEEPEAWQALALSWRARRRSPWTKFRCR